MSWAKADGWCTDRARSIASDIANIDGLFCGPAVVGWIAAVWNLEFKGRSYDYMDRLSDKGLFPDGPRNFFGGGDLPGWQTSVNAILERETQGDLGLGDDTHYKYGTIHDKLEGPAILPKDKFPDIPMIVRMKGPQFIDQLHYVALYKSEKKVVDWACDKIQFYWQDNGFYGANDGGNSGLYKSDWRSVCLNGFVFGSKKVVVKDPA